MTMADGDLLTSIAPEGLKIGLENLVSCQAACAGCTLTHEERTRGGLWTDDVSADAAILAQREIAAAAAIPGVREADLVGVQLFQGNHLLLPEQELQKLIRLLTRVARGKSNVILSTSPVGNSRTIERGLHAIAEARKETGLIIDTALILSDPRAYRTEIAEAIGRNTSLIRERFALTDAVLPVSWDPAGLPSPEDLHGTMVRDGFETLALALQPTRANAHLFAPGWTAIISWMRRLLGLWHAHGTYDLVLYKTVGRTIAMAARLSPDEIPHALARRLRRQLFIDHQGLVYFMQEGIGGDDMPLSSRFGFHPAAGGPGDFTPEMADLAATEAARRIWRGFLIDPRCARCPHKAACALSGVGQMKQAADGSLGDSSCPVGIRPLMDDLAAIVTERSS